jgi:hypothetical protein
MFKYILKLIKMSSPSLDKKKPTLISMGFSQFSEKSRWILDLSPLRHDYVESIHCPATHVSTTLGVSRLPRVSTWSPSTTVITDATKGTVATTYILNTFDRGAEDAIDSQSRTEYFEQSLKLRHSDKIWRKKEMTAVPKLILPYSYLKGRLKLKHHHVDRSNLSVGHSDGRSTSEMQIGDDDLMVVANGSAGISKLLSDMYPHELGHLYPSDSSLYSRVINLEAMLDRDLGSSTSDWVFGNMLLTGKSYSRDPLSTDSSINQGSVDMFIDLLMKSEAPWIEKLLWILLGKSVFVPLMITANKVSSDRTEPALEAIHRVFQQMDELLLRNNPEVSVTDKFLLATDKPTAADYAFAAMSIVVLLPQQTSQYLLSYEELNSAASSSSTFHGKDSVGCNRLIALATQLRSTYKSAQYVIKFYDKHRYL